MSAKFWRRFPPFADPKPQAVRARNLDRPRILILSASVGSGHVRAAAALESALRKIHPAAVVHHFDVLCLSLPIFRFFYGDMYIDLINKAPDVLRYFYNLMDEPRDCSHPSRWDRERVFLEKLGLSRFLRLLRRPWDLIINTHFLPGEIIAQLKRAGQMDVPQVTVTTDIETTHMWITEPCEHYTTATHESALFLQRQGVAAERTSVHGIPIDPVFTEAKSKAECRRRHGLAQDRPVVLQLAGGQGVGRIGELYRALLAVDQPLHIAVVTGRNEKAREHLLRLAPPSQHHATILGYTTKIDELMRAADLIVSKPGGLTTSEALAAGTPLVIVDPVPGQEERNSDWLLEAGAAVKVNHLLTLNDKITALLSDRDRLEHLRTQARGLARPNAAFDIVRRALQVMRGFWPHAPSARKAGGEGESSEKAVEVNRHAFLSPGGRGGFILPAAGDRAASNGQCGGADCPTPDLPNGPSWLDRFEVGAMHFFAHTWHRCRPEGAPRLPIRGPAIIVANHVNYSDPAFLIDACGVPVRFFHAAESFHTPLLQALFSRIGSVPVERNGRDIGAVRRALRYLERGEVIGVFPEGEVMHDGAAPNGVKTGAAFLALKSRAPVYPIHIEGGPQSGSVIADWLLPSRPVHVIMAPPLDLSAYYDRRVDHTLLAEVTGVILHHIRNPVRSTA